jgi:3-oxoadipate enol-lactonase
MPFTQTNDLKIYFEQAGSGPDLLILNGTGSDLRKKPNIMDSPLSLHFRLTNFDQRGLGQSDKPDHGYHMAAYADDAAALMDNLDIKTAMVLGISFGGMVAQEFAVRHGARIARMAIWCSSPGGAGGASYPLHELAHLTEDERVITGMRLNDTRVDDDWLADNPDAINAARERLDMSAYENEAGFEAGRAGQLAARAQHDCWDRLDAITCPVFLAGGEFDGIAKPQAMQAMQTKIPQAQLKLYQGGHLFMLQDGAVFPDLIVFLNEENT